MPTPNSVETLLAKFELYEPELGREFRFSPHLLMLGQGRSELTAWEASSLNYFYGPANTTTFDFFAAALRLPTKLEAALLRGSSANAGAWWQPTLSYYERIERIRVTGSEYELRYADKNGHYQLRLVALLDPNVTAILEWLATAPEMPMQALARGLPLDKAALQRFKLIPTWDDLLISASSRSQSAQELGVKFLCRALAVYPAHLLIWRGLGGESTLRYFVEGRLARRKKDFEAAAARLPAAPADFWAAPELPALPPLAEIAPDPGLGAHLPPAALWPSPTENQVFAEVLARVYKNVPKKVIKLAQE